MELLRFTDRNGREWEVWEVGVRPPVADRPAPATESYRGPDRWLCFASGTEHRRLQRYPRSWPALSPLELEALCLAAAPARALPAYVPRALRTPDAASRPDAGRGDAGDASARA